MEKERAFDNEIESKGKFKEIENYFYGRNYWTMAYYCNNDSCERKGIKESRAKFVLEEGKLMSRCSKCNSVKVSDSAPKKFGVPMFSAISLMTDEQKKDLLMKRSDADFKKNGEKYDKYMQDKEAIRARR